MGWIRDLCLWYLGEEPSFDINKKIKKLSEENDKLISLISFQKEQLANKVCYCPNREDLYQQIQDLHYQKCKDISEYGSIIRDLKDKIRLMKTKPKKPLVSKKNKLLGSKGRIHTLEDPNEPELDPRSLQYKKDNILAMRERHEKNPRNPVIKKGRMHCYDYKCDGVISGHMNTDFIGPYWKDINNG